MSCICLPTVPYTTTIPYQKFSILYSGMNNRAEPSTSNSLEDLFHSVPPTHKQPAPNCQNVENAWDRDGRDGSANKPTTTPAATDNWPHPVPETPARLETPSQIAHDISDDDEWERAFRFRLHQYRATKRRRRTPK